MSSANILHDDAIASGKSFIKIRKKEILRQSLVEHRMLHLATMKFVRLKQLFADALLRNFLIVSKDCPLFHKIVIQKVNFHAKPYQKLLKYRGKRP